jgi:hypothetical protein
MDKSPLMVNRLKSKRGVKVEKSFRRGSRLEALAEEDKTLGAEELKETRIPKGRRGKEKKRVNHSVGVNKKHKP